MNVRFSTDSVYLIQKGKDVKVQPEYEPLDTTSYFPMYFYYCKYTLPDHSLV